MWLGLFKDCFAGTLSPYMEGSLCALICAEYLTALVVLFVRSVCVLCHRGGVPV